jgi:hypothetical protein
VEKTGLSRCAQNKREARAQLFIIDPSSVSILFLSDPPPLFAISFYSSAAPTRRGLSVIITILAAYKEKKEKKWLSLQSAGGLSGHKPFFRLKNQFSTLKPL